MTVEKRLGIAIIMQRKKVGISQEDFARKAGIDRGYMSRIENGKTSISLAIIERIAKAFGITMSELLGSV